MKKIHVLVLILTTSSLFLYSQSENETINVTQYLNNELLIGSDYFHGIRVYNKDMNFEISSFGISSKLISLVSVSTEAKQYINNVNGNLIGGIIIEYVFAAGAGMLLGVGTRQDSQQDRFIYSLSSIGTVMVGILIGNIFTNNGYDNLFKAINAYNNYLLISQKAN